MISKVLLGFGCAMLTGWMIYRVVAPARAIWRGDASRVPTVPRMPPQARTYLLYAVWFTLIFGGVAVTMLAYAFRQLLGAVVVLKVIAFAGVRLSFAGIGLLPPRPVSVLAPRVSPASTLQMANRHPRRLTGTLRPCCRRLLDQDGHAVCLVRAQRLDVPE